MKRLVSQTFNNSKRENECAVYCRNKRGITYDMIYCLFGDVINPDERGTEFILQRQVNEICSNPGDIYCRPN